MRNVLGVGGVGLELWQVFAVLQAFVNDAQRQQGRVVSRLHSGRSIAQDAGQIDRLSDPPPIALAIDFEAQNQLRWLGTATTENLQQLHRTTLVAFYYVPNRPLCKPVQSRYL